MEATLALPRGKWCSVYVQSSEVDRFLASQASPDVVPDGRLRYARRPAKKLGKDTAGSGYLYIRTLEDVDKKALKEFVQASVKRMKQRSD